jgi:hypothetical protein
MEDKFVTTLPRKRTGNYLRIIANLSFRKIIICGIILYLSTILLFSMIEQIYSCSDKSLVNMQNGNKANFFELIYFNFVTILTIGYGDFSPTGIGRFFSVLESFIGVSILGLIISFITSKLLTSPQNSIVFSKYGYYCTEKQRFMVIFTNTTNSLFLNAEMCSYFKLGGDWGVRNSIRAPFISQSVQTFFIDKCYEKDLVEKLKEGDVLRFGIEGQIGYSSHSAAIEYSPDKIFVIPNREVLTSYSGFKNIDFSNKEVSGMFHYLPENQINLKTFIQNKRNTNDR